MKVKNNKKETARIYMLNDVQSILTEVTSVSNEFHDTISAIDNVVGGGTSIFGTGFSCDYVSVNSKISDAIKALNQSECLLRTIDISEKIDE